MQAYRPLRFGGETYYRYENREQRLELQSVALNNAFLGRNSADVTKVTWLPNPREGVAKVDIVELRGPENNREHLSDTEATRKAETWLEAWLVARGIQQVPKPKDWRFGA